MLTNEQVLNKLLEGNPVSVIRAGDGESIMLNALSSVTALQLASTAVLHRQLGYSPSIQDIEAIRLNLIEAYKHCDIVGLPNHKQKTDSHWAKVLTVLLDNVKRDPQADFCDIDIAYHWLQDGSYDKLLQDRKVLNYISCRDLDEGFKSKWGIEVVNKYTIAPEAKFTSGYDGELHYPTQFNKIPRWLDVMKQRHPGSLLLVGAGVIGKIYCNWWRDMGGVAMDVGGAMDCWAGKITRGPNRGLDVDDPDTKYKL